MPASPALYRAACQQGQSRARVGRKNSSACRQPPSTFAQEDSRAGWRERNRVTSPPPTCFRSDAEPHLSRSAFVDQDFHRGPHRADRQSPTAGLRMLRSMRTRSAIHPLTATVRWSFMAKWMSRSLGRHARPRRTARRLRTAPTSPMWGSLLRRLALQCRDLPALDGLPRRPRRARRGLLSEACTAWALRPALETSRHLASTFVRARRSSPCSCRCRGGLRRVTR